jgi:hypothetical protein
MKTTVWIDSEEVEELEALKLHAREPLGDVIHRLRVAGSSRVEGDAFEAAEKRFSDYLESKREEAREVRRQELRDKMSASAEQDAENRRVLGIDAEAGTTTPAWGTKRKSDEG